MTRICNFPIEGDKRCTQPMADDRPNCGRHSTELSADQLGQQPTAYEKDGTLHVWAGEPDSLYCLIHSDPTYQLMNQSGSGKPLYCLRDVAVRRDGYGELHRDDGPAMIWPNGEQRWYRHGELHRDDGPAVIWPDGKQEWYRYGERHRDDGPAEVWPDGSLVWYVDGKLHREDGPAVMRADGSQIWYRHGELHREDGPAIIRASGIQCWWWHDRRVSEQEHAELQGQLINA